MALETYKELYNKWLKQNQWLEDEYARRERVFAIKRKIESGMFVIDEQLFDQEVFEK